MSRAHGNLTKNPLFGHLMQSINGKPGIEADKVDFKPAEPETRAESCLFCHGTRLSVAGTETRDSMYGVSDFPIIQGWPNQGVGRINLDGSRGSCTACHTRHSFSIEMARKPGACEECHVGPDVPAYKVYITSKHGNIYSTQKKNWNFSKVPWTIGRDFTAPTCAACHMSQLMNTDGEVVVERTHAINDRLPWRIFGLVYAHPHPESPDTSIIRNAEGLPLPATLTGKFAGEYLIDEAAREERRQRMQSSCLNCHASSWVDGHWKRFRKTIDETNARTQTATKIMLSIWNQGYASGPGENGNPFDEAVEKSWSDLWLFYENKIRFASAMAGGGDYGVFADGRYAAAKRVVELKEWLAMQQRLQRLEGEESEEGK